MTTTPEQRVETEVSQAEATCHFLVRLDTADARHLLSALAPLEAENARLREALRYIQAVGPEVGSHWAAGAARAALQGSV
jgi:hypothetical protein